MKFYEITTKKLKQQALEWDEERQRVHKESLRFSRRQGASRTKVGRRNGRLSLVFNNPDKVDTTIWKKVGTDNGNTFYEPYRKKKNKALIAEMEALRMPEFNPMKELKLEHVSFRNGGLCVNRVQTAVRDGRVIIGMPDDYKPIKSLKRVSDVEAEKLGVIS